MKKPKRFITYILMFVLMVVCTTAIVLADDNVIDLTDSDPKEGGYASWKGKIVYSNGGGYGYRIYISDENGVIQNDFIVNIVQDFQPNSLFLTYGNISRLHTTSINPDGVELSQDHFNKYYKTNLRKFKNFLTNAANMDFREALARDWSMVETANGKYVFKNKTTGAALSRDEIELILNNYGDETGLNKGANRLGTVIRRLIESNNGKKYYVVAEPVVNAKKSNGTRFIGTATEILYLAGGVTPGVANGLDNDMSMNSPIACTFLAGGFLITDRGAGYQKYSYDGAWQRDCATRSGGLWHYESDLFANLKNPAYAAGTIILELNDLFTPCPDCVESECTGIDTLDCNPTLSYYRKGCCSCQKAVNSYNSFNGSIQQTLYNAYKKSDNQFPKSCNKPGAPICEYNHNTIINSNTSSSFVGTCDISSGASVNSGSIDNETSWQCVFGSTTLSNDYHVRKEYIVSDLSEKLNNIYINNYCQIYCKEKIEYEFPGAGAYTYKGRYLVIASNSGRFQLGPVTVTSTKTCSVTAAQGNATKGINYDQWLKDLKVANQEYADAWDEYQKELKKEAARQNVKAHESQRSGPYSEHGCTEKKDVWKSKITYCHNEQVNTGKTDKKGRPIYDNVEKCSDTYVDYSKCSEQGAQNTQNELRKGNYTIKECTEEKRQEYKEWWECPAGKFEHNGNREYYVRNYYSDVFYYQDTKGQWHAFQDHLSEEDCGHSHGRGSRTYPTSNVDGKRAIYNAAKNKRDALINAIYTCNNFSNNNTEFHPTMKMEYNDTVYGGTIELDDNYPTRYSYTTYPDGVYSNSTSDDKYSVSGSIRGKSAVFPGEWFECGTDGQPCRKNTNYVYPNNESFESVTVVTYSYRLPDNLNRYIIKKTGRSQSNLPSSGTNYLDMQIANLPISFSTNPGTYYYSLILTSFGTNDTLNDYVFNGASYDGKVLPYSGSEQEYSCTYEVKDVPDIQIRKGESDLIYRTISLTSPFPGESGTNRTPGVNWRGLDYYDKSITKIGKYITNNRGVNTYDVYDLDPMYEIELTPSLMRTIRQHNSTQNRANARGDVEGYGDFNLTCTINDGGRYTECISNTIRDWGVRGCGIWEASSPYSTCGTRNEAWGQL